MKKLALILPLFAIGLFAQFANLGTITIKSGNTLGHWRHQRGQVEHLDKPHQCDGNDWLFAPVEKRAVFVMADSLASGKLIA